MCFISKIAALHMCSHRSLRKTRKVKHSPQSKTARKTSWLLNWLVFHHAKFGCLHNHEIWAWGTSILLFLCTSCIASCCSPVNEQRGSMTITDVWKGEVGFIIPVSFCQSTYVPRSCTPPWVILSFGQCWNHSKSPAAFHTLNANHTVNLHAEVFCLASLPTKQCKCLKLFLGC